MMVSQKQHSLNRNSCWVKCRLPKILLDSNTKHYFKRCCGSRSTDDSQPKKSSKQNGFRGAQHQGAGQGGKCELEPSNIWIVVEKLCVL